MRGEVLCVGGQPRGKGTVQRQGGDSALREATGLRGGGVMLQAVRLQANPRHQQGEMLRVQAVAEEACMPARDVSSHCGW